MRISKEFRVGILVILGILLLYSGVNFLKGNSIFENDREFYALFQKSHGLQVSNEVQLNGVKIGLVKSVGLHPENPQLILVKFSVIKDEILIPDSSKINLISSDFLGTKALSLTLNLNAVVEERYHETGDTMISDVEMDIAEQINKELLPLKKKTEELIVTVDGIVKSVGTFWDTTAAGTIDESLYEFREAISKFGGLANTLSFTINEEIMVINDILTNVNDIAGNLNDKKREINHIIGNVDTLSTTLADMDLRAVILDTKQTLSELNGVLVKVNQGEGTLGALLHTDSLHNELIETNQSIQNLLDDMEANPNKYVHFSLFGRKVKSAPQPN